MKARSATVQRHMFPSVSASGTIRRSNKGEIRWDYIINWQPGVVLNTEASSIPLGINDATWTSLFFCSSSAVAPSRLQRTIGALLTESNCVFHLVGDHYVGSCGPLFDQTSAMTLKRASSITGGIWRQGLHPVAVWAGDMSDQGFPNAPIQLQVYGAGSGMLQTIYGWFPVNRYRTTPSNIEFEMDGQHEVPPDMLDVQIISRAAEILSNPAVWNRADNRKCPPSQTKWSIYCAGVRALEEVTGGTGGGHGIDHRRPALEVIRGVVDDRSKGRHYHHALMDYNNDPATIFADVQSLFSEASRRMEDSAWLTWMAKTPFIHPR